jgi:phage tail P2-like protein
MTLLPSNATDLERALEAVAVQVFDLNIPVSKLWSTQDCPAALLPYLAWALSVDDWDASWSEGRQREVIASSIEIQRHRGTRWAIKRTLEVLGYGTAQLLERYGAKLHDGSLIHDGSETYSPVDHWAEYRVILDRPITLAQADRVRAILAAVAPARCHLKALDYLRAMNVYDGAVSHDGTYSHGVA